MILTLHKIVFYLCLNLFVLKTKIYLDVLDYFHDGSHLHARSIIYKWFNSIYNSHITKNFYKTRNKVLNKSRKLLHTNNYDIVLSIRFHNCFGSVLTSHEVTLSSTHKGKRKH